jgi:hypothetical protein
MLSAAMPVVSLLPDSPKLKDVASWYKGRLGLAERSQLLDAVEVASAEGRPLRVGTSNLLFICWGVGWINGKVIMDSSSVLTLNSKIRNN